MDLYKALLLYKTIQSLKSVYIREIKRFVIRSCLIYTETPPLLRKVKEDFKHNYVIVTRVPIQNI
jgi:hypothetical protein